MKKKPDIKEQIWTAFFIVAPVVILTRLSENFGDSSTNRMLFAGLFGGLGGLLGWGLYYIVKSKTTITKTIALTAIIGLCISTIFITSYLTKSELTTCEICGYKTLKSTDTECAYCGNKTWDIVKSQKLTRFSEKKYWIMDEQISWFSIDSLIEKIDFYSPTIDEGFVKDKNWRPLVTEQDIKDELNYHK